MSDGQQAEANSARPIRSGGVLVNFPTAFARPQASPPTQDAEGPAGSDSSLHAEPRLDCSSAAPTRRNETMRASQCHLESPAASPSPLRASALSFRMTSRPKIPIPVFRNKTALQWTCHRNLCRRMNPLFDRSHRFSRRGAGWSGGCSRTRVGRIREVARGNRRQDSLLTSGPAALPSRSPFWTSVRPACTW
jgi:hypothetical protein